MKIFSSTIDLRYIGSFQKCKKKFFNFVHPFDHCAVYLSCLQHNYLINQQCYKVAIWQESWTMDQNIISHCFTLTSAVNLSCLQDWYLSKKQLFWASAARGHCSTFFFTGPRADGQRTFFTSMCRISCKKISTLKFWQKSCFMIFFHE